MSVYIDLPYNDSFDYTGFNEFMDDILGPTRVIDGINNQRLPGNTDMFTFLLYCGKLFNEWYSATFPNATENPLFTPGYPDMIYTMSNMAGVGNITPDSPHEKIPPVVSFAITRKEPASMTGGKMFGTGKNWKFRVCGDVKADDGNIYRLRSRFWEYNVEFTIIHRTGLEVENLCTIFEKFMDLNEGKFLEAGLSKMIPRGRFLQEVPKLKDANVHFRQTYYYFRTQEFQFAGPITPISDIEISALPT